MSVREFLSEPLCGIESPDARFRPTMHTHRASLVWQPIGKPHSDVSIIARIGFLRLWSFSNPARVFRLRLVIRCVRCQGREGLLLALLQVEGVRGRHK